MFDKELKKDCFWNSNRPTMDISGQRYGRWTVIAIAEKKQPGWFSVVMLPRGIT